MRVDRLCDLLAAQGRLHSNAWGRQRRNREGPGAGAAGRIGAGATVRSRCGLTIGRWPSEDRRRRGGLHTVGECTSLTFRACTPWPKR
jgi:hypothetical protein